MVLYLVILAGISFGFYLLFRILNGYFNISGERWAPIAYLIVFGISLACNAFIFVPVVFHISIMGGQ